MIRSVGRIRMPQQGEAGGSTKCDSEPLSSIECEKFLDWSRLLLFSQEEQCYIVS